MSRGLKFVGLIVLLGLASATAQSEQLQDELLGGPRWKVLRLYSKTKNKTLQYAWDAIGCNGPVTTRPKKQLTSMLPLVNSRKMLLGGPTLRSANCTRLGLQCIIAATLINMSTGLNVYNIDTPWVLRRSFEQEVYIAEGIVTALMTLLITNSQIPMRVRYATYGRLYRLCSNLQGACRYLSTSKQQ